MLELFQELMNYLQCTLRKSLQTTKQTSHSRVKSIESITSLRGTNTQYLDFAPMQINNVGSHVLSLSEDHTRDPANPADNRITNVEHTREKWQSATDVEEETTMDQNAHEQRTLYAETAEGRDTLLLCVKQK